MGSEEEQQQFTAIVSTFLSNDNEVRSQAEANYDGIPADKKVFLLLGLIRNNEVPEELRHMCAVLLRRLFTSHFEFAWNNLAPEAQAQVKNEMIALVLRDNENITMRKKLCEVTAELVRNLIDDDGNNSWIEFLQCLFQCTNSPQTPLRENALIVFALIPGIFGNQENTYLDLIKQMLSLSFASTEYSVRFYAGRALANFITDHDKEEPVLKHFSELLPPYLKIIEESVMKVEDDALLKLTIDILSLTPKFVRPQLQNLLQLCLTIGGEAQLPDDWRHLAIECCITAAETVPGAVKKVGAQIIPHLVQLLLALMADLDEDEDEKEWMESDEACEEDTESNSAVAESSLDRLACALGGKTILPIVMGQVQNMLGNNDYKQRHAGLMAVSAIGEGCLKQMEPTLSQIVEPILGFLKDPHPRVRYAACNALGQMATDFAPNYEKKFHSKILPGLIGLLQDHSCPRVQAHAGAALVNFCEECPRDILKNYAEPLLSTLEACFNLKLKELAESNKKLVLEQLVTTVASIANTLETDFVLYYDRFMPCMKFIMGNANSTELRLLRGKTIECASLIGLAVGADKFTIDASDIMDLLLRTQIDNGGVQLAEDDPQLSYMITAWARICQILGERFAPYLPMVMAPVLRTASVKPELQMLEPEDVDDVKGQEDWELISLGESQSVGLHTAKLEDKSMACQMLVCYARVMKIHFRPFVDEVVKIILPLLKFYFHDGVRSSAAEIIPFLLKCLDGDKNAQVQLWNLFKADLLIAIEAEPESDVKCEQLYALASSIEIIPKEALDQDALVKITAAVEKVFTEHFEKCAERAEQRKDEDYDEVVEDQLWEEMEEDNFVLTKASDIIHSMLKVYGADYLQFMEPKILELVAKLFAPDRYWQERQWALCIWDDIIEYTGPVAVKYQGIFLPTMIVYINDPSPEVRQAAAYGAGIMAQFGGAGFTDGCKQMIPRLRTVIDFPDSRGEINISATENAISAVAKIIKFCPASVNLDEIIPKWISWLPVWEDTDEMDAIYGLLCDLLEANSPQALGPQGNNLPRIVYIIAETFLKESLPENSNCRPRLINLIRMIQGNPQVFQTCVGPLSPEQQRALQDALQAAQA